jgi:site-specific DNA-methyltransferase (adenine-specific)
MMLLLQAPRIAGLLPARVPDNAVARNRIVQSDALKFMRSLPKQSVDLILTDPPYGTTACAWDTPIPFAQMWECYKRVIKPKGAIVMTASQPFTRALVMSNPSMFRHEWTWVKTRPTGYLNANRGPLKSHENIVVFSGFTVNYWPVFENGKAYRATSGAVGEYVRDKTVGGWHTINDGIRYPISVLPIDSVNGIHPTQKPVALFEYLIRTYTQPGDLVLDPFCGSGTTAIACRNTGRDFLCCDLSAEYVAIANKRLSQTDPYQSRRLAPNLVQRSLFEDMNT